MAMIKGKSVEVDYSILSIKSRVPEQIWDCH